MSVRVAKSAGFCFGVSRAVELVEQAAQSGKKVATLGPIIHNPQVVKDLEAMGVTPIDGAGAAQPAVSRTAAESNPSKILFIMT